jgi:hypothetical protein
VIRRFSAYGVSLIEMIFESKKGFK